MGSGLYVSLSAQLAADKRLATIANNVANLNTAGYRAEEVRFEEMVSKAGGQGISFTSTGETYTSRKPGPINPTGNPLDIAVEGQGWFAERDGATTAYTRDGRMSMSPEGELRTLSGRPILDASGAPVVIDPTGGQVRIGTDGSIASACSSSRTTPGSPAATVRWWCRTSPPRWCRTIPATWCGRASWKAPMWMPSPR